MKLIIQIPCYNESELLGNTIASIPDKFEGIDEFEILVIDDGSTDNTLEIGQKSGAVCLAHDNNRGLAKAFETGLKEALNRGADIIVNIDADNQYNATDIEKLIAPIISGCADMVIGARPIFKIKDFSLLKKILSFVGSLVVRVLSKTDVIDAVSGFRAFSSAAAKKIQITEKYTYTIETIFQAKINGMKIANVDIHVNPKLRDSRLIKKMHYYIYFQAKSIIKNYLKYYYKEFLIIMFFILLAVFIFNV